MRALVLFFTLSPSTGSWSALRGMGTWLDLGCTKPLFLMTWVDLTHGCHCPRLVAWGQWHKMALCVYVCLLACIFPNTTFHFSCAFLPKDVQLEGCQQKNRFNKRILRDLVGERVLLNMSFLGALVKWQSLFNSQMNSLGSSNDGSLAQDFIVRGEKTAKATTFLSSSFIKWFIVVLYNAWCIKKLNVGVAISYTQAELF